MQRIMNSLEKHKSRKTGQAEVKEIPSKENVLKILLCAVFKVFFADSKVPEIVPFEHLKNQFIYNLGIILILLGLEYMKTLATLNVKLCLTLIQKTRLMQM